MAVVCEGMHELEVLDEGVVLARDGPHHHRGVGRGLLAVEHVALAARAPLDAAQAPHEVEVPIAAAELSVGHHLEAGGLLLGHQVTDGDVLHALELGGVNHACIEVGAGLLEDVGAQETADDVAAEGGVGARSHG